MSFRVELPPTFADRLAANREANGPAQVGLFISSGSNTNAEIVGSTGFDWVLIDAEHSPYGLQTIQDFLRTLNAFPGTPVVRIAENSTVLIKQTLDAGAQNVMVPMVHTVEAAEQAVAAMHYPPRGVRGIGAALARSSRYNAVEGYLAKASETVSLTVQVESGEAVKNSGDIAAVDGVDAVFIGPSDLAASMGYLGQQQHPEVLEAISQTFKAVKNAGKPVGVNAFNIDQAEQYVEAGADFVCIGADVQQLAAALKNLLGGFRDRIGAGDAE